MRVNWFPRSKRSLELISFRKKQNSCWVLPTQCKSSETFFQRSIFFKASSFRIVQPRRKGYIQLDEWRKNFPACENHVPEIWSKRKKKKKRELWIQPPYWYFCRKFVFVMYNFFCFGPTASKYICLSNSMLLFYLIYLFIYFGVKSNVI